RYRVPFSCEDPEPPTDISHSSRTQISSLHQSPDVRHGPASFRTFPRMIRPVCCTLIRVGHPAGASTCARNGGLNTLNPKREAGKKSLEDKRRGREPLVSSPRGLRPRRFDPLLTRKRLTRKAP